MATASLLMVESIPIPDSLGYEQDVASLIRRAVAGKQPIDRRVDQRRDARYAFPYPITLLPLEAAIRGESNKVIPAIGKHLTLRGIDFYTTRPLVAKEVVCQLQAPHSVYAVVLELNWCRHNAQGWFENGGKFLRVWKESAALRD